MERFGSLAPPKFAIPYVGPAPGSKNPSAAIDGREDALYSVTHLWITIWLQKKAADTNR
jgi:hypothetical protein